MTLEIAELQVIIIVVALVAGAIRGIVGYWITAPEDENFNVNKIGKTMTRYAIFNLVSVNILAVAGIMWLPITVVIYTVVQLAPEIGYDFKKS